MKKINYFIIFKFNKKKKKKKKRIYPIDYYILL